MGEELAKIIDEASNHLLTGSYTINDSSSSFKEEEINDTHIRNAISKIKTSKGFGAVTISSYSLKLALPFINNFLVYIFNTSMQTGVFPSQWKTARSFPFPMQNSPPYLKKEIKAQKLIIDQSQFF